MNKQEMIEALRAQAKAARNKANIEPSDREIFNYHIGQADVLDNQADALDAGETFLGSVRLALSSRE